MTAVLDHGYVTLVESWGSDERIIEAARMSTAKGFTGWGTADQSGDEKLLRYLWEHQHMTPFEMAGLVVEVQAPIFVLREWHRHRTQSYNELSARYTPLPDLFYVPSIDRLMHARQGTTNKQGSSPGFGETAATELRAAIEKAYEEARAAYEELLQVGVAREVARLVIPVGQYSRMRASANLRNWLAFLTLRLAPNAQLEIREYAKAVGGLIAQAFPRTWELSQDGMR
jgi:thymidylate synthase (FAD)